MSIICRVLKGIDTTWPSKAGVRVEGVYRTRQELVWSGCQLQAFGLGSVYDVIVCVSRLQV